MALATRGRMRRASGVALTPLAPRARSCTPKCLSSRPMALLTCEGVTRSSRAAPEMVPVLVTASSVIRSATRSSDRGSTMGV